MSDLGAQIVMEVATMRYNAFRKKQKQARKDSERHARENAAIASKVAKRRAPPGTAACLTAPWNRLTPETEMRLFLCESVRKCLYALEDAEYERKRSNA